MSVQSDDRPGSEGKRFEEKEEKTNLFGSTVLRPDRPEDAHKSKSCEDCNEQEKSSRKPGSKCRSTVVMETASSGQTDTHLVKKSSEKEHDLYASVISDQSYSFKEEALYFCGNQKLEKEKTLASPFGVQIPSLESQHMFSSDLAIKMIPEKSMDVARNLLETERMQAYNYMDISNREDTLVEQYFPLENWGEGDVTDTESHLKKKHLGTVEPLPSMLDSQTYQTHKHHASSADQSKDLSDHQAYQTLGSLHTTNPMSNTQTEPPAPSTASSPEYHPPVMSESILSLGVMGVPTVTLSEYMDDSPDSSADDSDSPLDVDFQSTEGTAESAGGKVIVSAPTLPASQDTVSAESGDLEIKLVSPPDCNKPTSTPSISFLPAGAPTSVQPTPPILYSILREEREAELDSELLTESFEESPKKQHAALSSRAQKSNPWSAAASSIPSSVVSSSTVETPFTEPFSSNIGHQFMNEKDTVEVTPLTALASTGARVEQPTVEEKIGKQRRGSQSRRWSVRRASIPVFLWELEQQKAVDLLYWRDVKKTGLLLSTMLLLLLSLTQFSVVSVGAYLALAVLSTTVSFRIYKSVLQAVQKTDEGHPFKSYLETDMTLSPEQMQKYAEGAQYYISCILRELRRLFLVQDLVDSLKFSVLMWLLTYVGTLFNGLTLLIMVVVSMFSMPVVYEKYQVQIDQYLGLMKNHVNCVVGKIQEKIPGAKRKTE